MANQFKRKDFLEQHGIIFANIQWAWGGINEYKKEVFLTAWADRVDDKGNYPIALPWKDKNGRVKLGYKDSLRLIELVTSGSHRLRLMVSKVKQPWQEGQTRTIEDIIAMPYAEPFEGNPGEWWAKL